MTGRREVQRSLKTSCRLDGVGLHTGVRATVVLEPAGDDQGIRFVRGDIPGAEPIPATISHVVDTPFCTTLRADRWQVGTIEHLMAALCGCGVDNLTVVVHGPEVPILDGSAWPFVEALDAAGVLESHAPRRGFRLTEPVSAESGRSAIQALPAAERRWVCTIQFAHPLVGRQHAEATPETFRASVARARTFGMLDDVEAMRREGLAKGGTLENALVMGENGWLNPEQVRYADEPVRHKLLDLMGDSLLLGFPLLARLQAFRPGHALTRALLRRILAAGSTVLEPMGF